MGSPLVRIDTNGSNKIILTTSLTESGSSKAELPVKGEWEGAVVSMPQVLPFIKILDGETISITRTEDSILVEEENGAKASFNIFNENVIEIPRKDKITEFDVNGEDLAEASVYTEKDSRIKGVVLFGKRNGIFAVGTDTHSLIKRKVSSQPQTKEWSVSIPKEAAVSLKGDGKITVYQNCVVLQKENVEKTFYLENETVPPETIWTISQKGGDLGFVIPKGMILRPLSKASIIARIGENGDPKPVRFKTTDNGISVSTSGNGNETFSDVIRFSSKLSFDKAVNPDKMKEIEKAKTSFVFVTPGKGNEYAFSIREYDKKNESVTDDFVVTLVEQKG